MNQNFIALDIETAKPFPSGEDWREHRPLGIACAVTTSTTNGARPWHGHNPDGSPALGEWRTRCPELMDDQVLLARSCIMHAHEAVASQAGLTIRRHEKLNSVRSRIKQQGWNLPETEIPLREYNWYDNHSFSTVTPVMFHPTMTAVVRRDVQNVLRTSPTPTPRNAGNAGRDPTATKLVAHGQEIRQIRRKRHPTPARTDPK